MAKKIKKRKGSMLQVFLVLLIPWLIMGIVAAVAFYAGLPDYAAILLALAASLIVTFYIGNFVFKKRSTR